MTYSAIALAAQDEHQRHRHLRDSPRQKGVIMDKGIIGAVIIGVLIAFFIAWAIVQLV